MKRLDPNQISIAAGAGLVVAGFATIIAAWAALAPKLEVPLQLPYVVSGSFAGLGLIATGLTVINVQVTRRLNARRRDRIDAILDAARGERRP